MSQNPGFQVSVDLEGRPCMVIGGDEEAVEKVNRLLEAGAKVTVVHPTLHVDLRKLTASGKIIHRLLVEAHGQDPSINHQRARDPPRCGAMYRVFWCRGPQWKPCVR